MEKKKSTRKKRQVTAIKFDDVRKNVMMEKVEKVDYIEQGETISASNLPDGIHKAQIKLYVDNMTSTKLCVVAVRKLTTSWEAFVGYPDVRDLSPGYKKNSSWESFEWCCENIRNVSQVKMLGVKLSRADAVKLFPDWKVFTYFE